MRPILLPAENVGYKNKPMIKGESQAFTMAFIYPHPAFGKPFIMKGAQNRVMRKIKERNIPCLVHFTCWRDRQHRWFMRMYGVSENVWIEKGTLENVGKYLLQRKCDNGKIKTITSFEKVPRKWIGRLNRYLTITVKKVEEVEG